MAARRREHARAISGYLPSAMPNAPRPLRPRHAALALVLAALPAAGAHAARPMVTDDARIVDPKACQLESWVRSFRNGADERWALPGCNPFGGFELTLGGARLHPAGEPARSVFQGQVKTLLRPLATDDWGWGIAFGTLNTLPRASTDGRNHPYFYVPVSVSTLADRLVLHVNVGATRGPESGRDVQGIWGVGLEWAMHPRALVVAETYGVTGERVQGQFGLRLWAVPERVQVDATWGGQQGPGGVGHWISIGLRLLSPPFLP
jgi:hypothetical protein